MTETSVAASPHLARLARGGALGLAGSVVAVTAGFAVSVVVARGLDTHDVGVFFSVTSVLVVLVAGCVLGVDSGLARFLLRLEAEGRHDDVRRTVQIALLPALGVALVVAPVLVAGAPTAARWLGLGADGVLPLRVVAVALPWAVASEVVLSGTRAFGEMRTTVTVDRLLRAGLQVVGVGVVVAAGGRLATVVGAWAASYAVAAVVAGVALARLLRSRARAVPPGPAPVPTPGLTRRFWAFTAPRGVSGLAQVAIQRADIVIVAALLSPADAAVYAVATRFVAVGQMANQAIHQVLQPGFTAILLAHDRATLRHVHAVATTWGILLVWPVYLVVGCAPVVYLSVFGGAYGSGTTADGGTAVVVVMAGAMLVAVATGPVDTLLLMAGRSGLSMTNSLLALAVDVGLCLVLVPRMGIAGAAVAWAAAVTLRSGLAFTQVHRHLGVAPGAAVQLRAAARPVLCFAVPVACFTAVGLRDLGAWTALCLLCGGLYLVVLSGSRRRLDLDLLVASLRGRAATRPRHVSDPHPPKESDSAWTPAPTP